MASMKGSESINRMPTIDGTGTSTLVVSGSRKSFWDEDFEHLAHGRAHNFSTTDNTMLSGKSVASAREEVLRCLHQAEASTIFLIDRMEALELNESVLTDNLDKAKKDAMQLRSDVADLADLRKTLEQKELELTSLQAKLDELMPLKTKLEELTPKVEVCETQIQELTTKCQNLENEKEELADQLCSTLNQGFQLALDQVKILCPDADISLASITKEVIEGQLVEIGDE
ncbi:hypothetical protein DEO72_LG11g3921 [Vigna unguiculata]|uniref:Uncharacterized protein n=1 Tax=Vigna unguiculata TaxID=3917 RepID=A0A4D6NV87_VIGUN|nr:hypothetical protein DEO72_LG11g3921 [Vigna unguiculata]